MSESPFESNSEDTIENQTDKLKSIESSSVKSINLNDNNDLIINNDAEYLDYECIFDNKYLDQLKLYCYK
jgi:hypothetical protein